MHDACNSPFKHYIFQKFRRVKWDLPKIISFSVMDVGSKLSDS